MSQRKENVNFKINLIVEAFKIKACSYHYIIVSSSFSFSRCRKYYSHTTSCNSKRLPRRLVLVLVCLLQAGHHTENLECSQRLLWKSGMWHFVYTSENQLCIFTWKLMKTDLSIFTKTIKNDLHLAFTGLCLKYSRDLEIGRNWTEKSGIFFA